MLEPRYKDDMDEEEDDKEDSRRIIPCDHSLPQTPQRTTITTTTYDDNENDTNSTTKCVLYILLVILCVSGVICSLVLLQRQDHPMGGGDGYIRNTNNTNNMMEFLSESHLPPDLLDLGIYDPTRDFENEIGISPPYWNPSVQTYYPNTKTHKSHKSTTTTSSATNRTTWGPCYPDRSIRHWNVELTNQTKYQFRHDPNDIQWDGPPNKDGTCRPGFIIIGAGKCGTSSLYHYLLGHPRVAPAFSKQIHYFIYHLNKPMEWYYSWFPKAQSFLQHGALITGEASPGYLPYPRAVKSAFDRLQGHPKFIAIGRNPLTRMYSSYRYNYRTPTLQTYQAGQKRGVPGRQPDEYYDKFIFTFEELIRAELYQLKRCLLVPGGFGADKTRNKWYREQWTRAEFDRRQENGWDPLIDLDEVCYGQPVNRTVLRPQWAELQMTNPEKYIPPRNAFLIQSLIGRSLYVFPLEWWYILFDPNDILFFCTEDLNEPTKLNDLSMQLGLPSFDYTAIVDQGAFNVGTNQGYDQATPWDELESDPLLTPPDEYFVTKHAMIPNGSEPLGQHDDWADAARVGDNDSIPLSAELKKELLDFLQPYNERLFRLTGKRCHW